MRLQKYLARAGIASRRRSEALIAAGRVSVDGEVVTRPGTTVEPGRQTVAVDGVPVEPTPRRWLALHKPPGYLCTRSDPRNRPTVYALLPEAERELFHVGRLDFMSEGLLLLTNDGDTAHALLHPSREVTRRYRVHLVGPVSSDLPARLEAGVTLSDGPASADRASLESGTGAAGPVLEIELHEGRNREIRRMLAALEVRIERLKRVALGPIELGDLGPGDFRLLTEEETARLRACAG